MMSISVEKKYIESQFINQMAKMMNEWVPKYQLTF